MSNSYLLPTTRWWQRSLLAGALALGLIPAASAQWVTQNSAFPAASTGIADISIVDANTVWAAGYDGTTPTNPFNGFTRTTNGGTTWTAGTIPAGLNLNFANISGASGTVAWAAMYNGTGGGGAIFKTTNGGASWTQQLVGAFPAAQGGFTDGVMAFDANTAVAFGDPLTTTGLFEIYRTTNGGTTWSTITAPAALAGEFGLVGTFKRVGNSLWFATNTGRVYRSTNQGQTWSVATVGTIANISRLAFSSATVGLAMDASNTGLLMRTADGGITWALVIPTGSVYAQGLAGITTSGAFVSTGGVAGASGSSYSTDAGNTWTNIDNGVVHTAVAFLNNQTGWSGSFNTSSTQGGILRGSIPTGTGSYCTTNLGGSSCDLTQVSILGTTLNTAPSGCTFVNGSQYSSYPASGATTATLNTGQVYTLAINTNTSVIASLWIDWDQNNSFDASEWSQISTATTAGTAVGVSFTVPATALTGQTRLRIRTRVTTSPNGATDACTQFGTGETEDYTITVQAGTANPSDPSPYCAAVQTFGCTGPSIINVSITGTTLNNASSCSNNTAGHAYTRYTATGSATGSVQRGQTYAINVATDASAIVSAWADWNQNSTFDASEWVQVYTTGTAGTVTLAVPATATLGQTRLRVRSRVSGSLNGSGDACTAFGSGEGEDYTITVLAGNTSTPAPYCVASHQGTCGSADITRVTLTGTALNNTSTCSTNAAGDAYTNYPASGTTTGTVLRGQTYQLGVDASTLAVVSVWVDWNRNNTLETTEWLQVYLNAQTGTILLPVPATASLGQTRMRIRSRVSGTQNGAGDACTAMFSGETEDYTLTVTGCTLAAPTLAANGPVCAGTTLTLTAQGVAAGSSYQWTGPNGFASTATSVSIPNVTTAAAGAYSLTITNAGCSISATPITVVVNAAPAAPTTTGATTCGPGTVTLTANGGTTYKWYTTATGGTAIAGATSATYAPTVNATTTYYVSTVNGAGCESPRTAVTATVNALPTATITAGGATTFCAGGSVTLTAANGGTGATYQWLLNTGPISGATNRSYIANQAGSYTVTVTSAATCSATSTATVVTVNALPSAAFAYATSTFCLGTAATVTPSITGTTGGTFSAQPAGLALNSATGAISLAASSAGTYTVTYLANNGQCSATQTQTITLTTAPLATFAYPNATACVGASALTPTFGTGASAGVFSAAPAGLALDPVSGVVDPATSQPGTYTVTNTLAASGSCPSATASAVVSITAAPNATLTAGGATTFCQGGSVTLTATGGGLYVWSNGQSGASITVTQSGTYSVTVTNASNCSATPAPITVTVNPTPATPTITATPQAGGAVLLTSSAGSGNQWYFNGGPLPGATGTTYLVTDPTQSGLYTVQATGVGGCASAPSVPINVVITATAADVAGPSLLLYPNPTPDGLLTLDLTGYTQSVDLTLFDAVGRAVFTTTRQPGTSSLDLHALPTGVYQLRARTEAGTLTRRIVRQ